MKIFINFDFQNEELGGGLWGGANQFLLALKKFFIKEGLYSDDPINCDIFLMNSHHNVENIWKIKTLNPNMVICHRVDGPISTYSGLNEENRDKVVFYYNMIYADATLFQSEYSLKATSSLGFKFKQPTEIILNACDNSIFFPALNKIKNKKIKLVASAWSDNENKGKYFYQFLDENLDFDKYEFTFIGRIKYQFKNSKYISPQSSVKLAEILREQDIFISASLNDPCANSILEALSCGLPVVYLNSGGHPELVREGGKSFENKDDILNSIDLVAENYDDYRKNIKVKTFEEIGKQYVEFFKKMMETRS